MPFFLAVNNGAASFNIFSSPPPIPSNLNTATRTPSPPLPIPTPLPRKHPRKDDKGEEKQRQSENGKEKGKGKQVYKHRGWYTTKVGEEKGVIVGDEGGVSYKVAGAPFEFKFSYSETPKVSPLALREPPFVPFARQTLNRPWTGRAPLPKSKKMLPELDSFNPPKPGTKGVKYVQPPGPFFMANGPDYRASTREEILGEPLTKDEKYELLEKSIRCTRQVNLGRDGLTHNMLELIHTHWKRRRVCKIKCKGVPTVDMNNVCHYLEEKTGGKIIHHIGGVVHLFRGRNYNYKSRPKFPLMLWKPATPVYPKLILRAPEGLTVEEADALRRKARHLPAICKLGKNGVYFNLVKQIRKAFEEMELVRINCRGMKPTDYKRIGAKLKDLVPCVLLSFDKEHILMWRGKEYKVKNPIDSAPVPSAYGNECVSDDSTNSRVADNQLSDQIVCTNLEESTTLYTELANQRNVSSSKDAALEDIMVTSQHNETLEDELNRSHISVQSREFVVLAEKGRHDFDDSKDETSIEVKDSSELGNVSKRNEHIHASDMEGQSNTTNVPEYAGNNSSTNSAAIVVNSSETSSESLCFPSAGVGVFDAKIMETVGKDSLDLLSKLDHQKQNDMHGVANVSEDKDSKEKGILTIKEGNGCSETAVAIEHLWQQAIESRMALLLDESGLDPDTVLKKTDDFAQAASPGPYVTYKQALSARKGSRHKKRAVKDEERNKFDGNKTSQHINKKESEEIPPFSDMVPLGMLPVDDLAKLLLAP